MSPEQREPARFPARMRVLHWLLATLLVCMLFIGVSMVASLRDYQRLLALHRPLGIAIFVLAIVRLINRRLSHLPPFPATMSERERRIASASEWLLYGLMLSLPLVGWGMLSAGSYPIVMWGSWHLPPILPASPALHHLLRRAHTVLAYTLFLTFLGHLSAVLFHSLIVRDGLLRRMASWRK
jgi:cytochrome b561